MPLALEIAMIAMALFTALAVLLMARLLMHPPGEDPLSCVPPSPAVTVRVGGRRGAEDAAVTVWCSNCQRPFLIFAEWDLVPPYTCALCSFFIERATAAEALPTDANDWTLGEEGEEEYTGRGDSKWVTLARTEEPVKREEDCTT